MKGQFVANMDRLEEQVRGQWQAKVEVDQVYAHYQEVHPEFRHPRGGQAFYLRDSLYLGQWFARMAVGLITPTGVHVKDAMVSVANGISFGVYLRAPWEFNDLRRSGHPSVTRDGSTVYDRPPIVGRLSEEQLRRKGQLRYLSVGKRGRY